MAAPFPLQMRTLSTRTVKKLEKPRPLKICMTQNELTQIEPYSSLQYQAIMTLVDNVSNTLENLSNTVCDDEVLVAMITTMLSKLKDHGQQLEAIFMDQLDRAFMIFKKCCQNDTLPCTIRLHLLELVELRANQWLSCDNKFKNGAEKSLSAEMEPVAAVTEFNKSNPISVHRRGELLKSTGKFPDSVDVPEKHYKDNVVIQNSDSREHQYTVALGNDTIKIIGANHQTVRNVRLMLEEYYETWLKRNCIGDTHEYNDELLNSFQVEMTRKNSVDPGLDAGFSYMKTTIAPDSSVVTVNTRPEWNYLIACPDSMITTSSNLEALPLAGMNMTYSRQFLLECTFSIHSLATPPNWDQIAQEYPEIVKKQ